MHMSRNANRMAHCMVPTSPNFCEKPVVMASTKENYSIFPKKNPSLYINNKSHYKFI